MSKGQGEGLFVKHVRNYLIFVTDIKTAVFVGNVVFGKIYNKYLLSQVIYG